MSAPTMKATKADLHAFPGKAELIAGRIVELMATGRKPNCVAGRIYRSLDDHATATGQGEAYTDNMGFTVPELPSGRESFSPDASYHEGPFPADDMEFIEGAPKFAVEVRIANDYGNAAEEEMAAKRDDYFQAGTWVVWDVDPRAEVIRKYLSAATAPHEFHRGEVADADPAVPGWRMKVSEIFGYKN